MTSKEALECIIYRLTAQEDDLELRETAKVEIEIIKKDLDRLEELEKKETPMKPIHHLNSFYRCENCDELFQNYHYQNYCPNCGQKLDWEIKK